MSKPEFGEISENTTFTDADFRKFFSADVAEIKEPTIPSVPPQITEDTISKVLNKYNLGSLKNPDITTYTIGWGTAVSHLRSIRFSDGDSLGKACGEFFSGYFNGDEDRMTSAGIGAGFILDCFSMQFEPDFLLKFQQVNPNDIGISLRNSLNVTGKKIPFEARSNMFTRAEFDISLPEHQPYLQRGLDRLKVPLAREFCVEDGFISMYNTIAGVWDKMYPSEQNHGQYRQSGLNLDVE